MNSRSHLSPTLLLCLTLPFALPLVAASAAAQEAVAVVEASPETTSEASAEAPSSGALTDRPFFVGIGLGGTFGLRSGGGAAFSLEEDFGYRFFGFTLGDSLDAAIWAGLSFGQSFGDGGFFVLQFDARGGLDLELFDNGSLQLLVTPSLALGGAVIGVNNGFISSTSGAFDLQISAQAELVLLEGLLGIFLRPLSFEFYIYDGTGVNYEVLAGVNFRF